MVSQYLQIAKLVGAENTDGIEILYMFFGSLSWNGNIINILSSKVSLLDHHLIESKLTFVNGILDLILICFSFILFYIVYSMCLYYNKKIPKYKILYILSAVHLLAYIIADTLIMLYTEIRIDNLWSKFLGISSTVFLVLQYYVQIRKCYNFKSPGSLSLRTLVLHLVGGYLYF